MEIKYNDFKTISHQTVALTPMQLTSEISKYACTLFDEIWNGNPIRLLGVRTTKLSEENEPEQMNIFDYISTDSSNTNSPEFNISAQNNANYEKQKKLQNAINGIRDKYGKDAIKKGL